MSSLLLGHLGYPSKQSFGEENSPESCPLLTTGETVLQATQTPEAQLPGRADAVHLLDVSGGHQGTVGEGGLPSRKCTFLPAGAEGRAWVRP